MKKENLTNDELENKEEVPAPEENKEVEAKPELQEDCVDILPFGEGEDVQTLVEEKRAALHASFKKSRMISRISMGVVLLMVIGAIILITFNNMALKIVGYSLAGVTLIAMIIYYILNKNKIPSQSKVYISEVTLLLNRFVYNDARFSDMKSYPTRKIQKADFTVDRVYGEISEIGNRNSIEGKFNGKDFKVDDVALYFPTGDRRAPQKVAFLGKYINLTNSLKLTGRYIINLKGEGKADKDGNIQYYDQPRETSDLKLLKEDDNLMIYGPEDKELDKKIFDSLLISKLKAIEVKAPLLNLVAVIWEGHTGIYLSYDDAVTTLPFEHPFTKDAQAKYQSDLINVLEILGKK